MTAQVTTYDNVGMSPANRCDRCGAQAYVEVLLPSESTLMFCAHHWKDHKDALTGITGAVIADHTPLLEAQEAKAEPIKS